MLLTLSMTNTVGLRLRLSFAVSEGCETVSNPFHLASFTRSLDLHVLAPKSVFTLPRASLSLVAHVIALLAWKKPLLHDVEKLELSWLVRIALRVRDRNTPGDRKSVV